LSNDEYVVEEMMYDPDAGMWVGQTCTNLVSSVVNHPYNPTPEEAALIGGFVGSGIGLLLFCIAVLVLWLVDRRTPTPPRLRTDPKQQES
jgi:hypothetical protein